VGIDHFEPPVPRLKGCVNDIGAFETYLRSRAGEIDVRLHVLRGSLHTALEFVTSRGTVHHVHPDLHELGDLLPAVVRRQTMEFLRARRLPEPGWET
jgi:hypothetical protein